MVTSYVGFYSRALDTFHTFGLVTLLVLCLALMTTLFMQPLYKHFDKVFNVSLVALVAFCLGMAALFYAASVEKQEHPAVLVEDTIDQFKLVEMTPPKHVYVTLQNVRTGEIRRHYISKHCSAQEGNSIGAIYNLRIEVWRDWDGSRHTFFKNLDAEFC